MATSVCEWSTPGYNRNVCVKGHAGNHPGSSTCPGRPFSVTLRFAQILCNTLRRVIRGGSSLVSGERFFLKMGVTRASRQSFGTALVEIDC